MTGKLEYHSAPLRKFECSDENMRAEIELQAALDEAATPFENGTDTLYGSAGIPYKYLVQNDGWRITITKPNDAHFGKCYVPGRLNIDYDQDIFVRYAGNMLNDYPNAAGLYGVTTDDEQLATSVTIPTLARKAAFQKEALAGLPVAGIRHIQTVYAHGKYSNVFPFVARFDRKLFPTSYAIDGYIHDARTHWLGSASTHEFSWEGVDALYSGCARIVGTDPSLMRQYMICLGDGIDFSTGSILNRSYPKDWTDESIGQHLLVSSCLQNIFSRLPRDVFDRSVAVISDLGLGDAELVERNGYICALVPWEFKNLPNHYKQVHDRLGITWNG